jgi:hypothetical protein
MVCVLKARTWRLRYICGIKRSHTPWFYNGPRSTPLPSDAINCKYGRRRPGASCHFSSALRSAASRCVRRYGATGKWQHGSTGCVWLAARVMVVNCELEARSAGCACLDAGCCRSFQGPADYLIEKHRDSSRNRKCCKTEPFLRDFLTANSWVQHSTAVADWCRRTYFNGSVGDPH